MSARMNWKAAADRSRVRRQGAETIDGQLHGVAHQPDAAEDSQSPARSRRPHLTETLVIAKWWRNRGGKSIWVRLMPFKDFDLVDIRTWSQDEKGISQPEKGFACQVKHLPTLHAAIGKTLQRARELGLIYDDEGADP
jgi:hypothetical protein